MMSCPECQDLVERVNTCQALLAADAKDIAAAKVERLDFLTRIQDLQAASKTHEVILTLDT
jgi:hypothetical protein